MKNNILLGALLGICINIAGVGTASATELKTLGLQEIIERSLSNSPAIKIAATEFQASRGDYDQSRSYTNPELSIEAEDFAGSGIYKDYGSAQTTYGISQEIAIGGKYSARSKAAEYGLNLSSSRQEVTKIETIRNVKIAYAEAVAAQKNLDIAREQKQVAEDFLKNVTKRVDAAAEPLFQKSKAEVALSTASVDLSKAEQDLKLAKGKLALLWGSSDTDFELSDKDFTDAGKLPDIDPETLKEIIKSSHYARIYRVSEAQSKELYELEKTKAIPDPKFNLGFRELNQSDDQAFVAGLSIPIPVFDQNSGNIEKARSQINRMQELNKLDLLELQNQVLASYGNMKMSYDQISAFRDKILPSAERSFQQTRAGYNAGKFPYIEVVDSLRTLSAAKFSYNNLLKEYHIKKAEIERFIGNQTAN